MKFQGFIGGSYTLNSVNVDCQRCVNLYPELIESGTGKEGQVAYLLGTPGLEELFTVGDGPIRLIHADPSNTRILIVSGNKLYRLYYTGSAWTPVEKGTLDTATGPVRAESATIEGYGTATVFVDGTNSYIYGSIDDAFDDFAGVGATPVPGATHVVSIDGYLIYNQGGTNQFFVTELNDFEADPLGFASAEGDADKIIAMLANDRYLWLFNEKTTEVFSNTGNADFPFERISGGFIEKGCVAAYSVAKIDGFIMWLGRDNFGQGIVYAAQGLTPQRISTHAIEQAIQGYADITTATAYTYQSGGHSFYVLNFAEMTWVYDLSTKLWHERAYAVEGELGRHRGACHVFFPAYGGLHLVGDYVNNKIYQFNDEYYSDDGEAIVRERTFPHISGSLKRMFHKSLQLDMETGVGLDGGVQGSDPQVMLQWSNDGGHTWSDEEWASAGNSFGSIGDYKKRVMWRRLGSARDRVYKMRITDPVKVILMSVEIDVEGGSN